MVNHLSAIIAKLLQIYDVIIVRLSPQFAYWNYYAFT